MTKVVDLRLERIEREPDNAKVAVDELLHLVLKNIADGEFKNARRAMVIIVDEGPGENSDWTFTGYRCGMRPHEEIGLLETFKAQQIRRLATTKKNT